MSVDFSSTTYPEGTALQHTLVPHCPWLPWILNILGLNVLVLVLNFSNSRQLSCTSGEQI